MGVQLGPPPQYAEKLRALLRQLNGVVDRGKEYPIQKTATIQED